MSNYLAHLKLNLIIARHAMRDCAAHCIHGLIPAIKIKHHQPVAVKTCGNCGISNGCWGMPNEWKNKQPGCELWEPEKEART